MDYLNRVIGNITFYHILTVLAAISSIYLSLKRIKKCANSTDLSEKEKNREINFAVLIIVIWSSSFGLMIKLIFFS